VSERSSRTRSRAPPPATAMRSAGPSKRPSLLIG